MLAVLATLAFAKAWANPPLTGIVQISAGLDHTCAVTTSGAVKCWGKNENGQLGDNSFTDRSVPVQVWGLTSGVASVAAAGHHTCALTVAGGMLCWGDDEEGQLGDGTTTHARLTPVPVSGLSSGVAAMGVGESHTCAVTTAGALLCWGANWTEQLGDGTAINRPIPVAVSGLSSGVAGAAGGIYHTCAWTTAGMALCWGGNGGGQLGDGTTTTRPTPVQVSGLATGVANIAAGSIYTCAATTAGAARCWGYNGQGELGDGTTTVRLTPVPVSGLSSGVSTIAAGNMGEHTCALDAAGGVQCWGWNDGGQLGDGSQVNRLTPVQVSGLTSGVTAVAAGGGHSCALITGGGVLCWGKNGFGQLGDGSNTWHFTPVPVSGLSANADLSDLVLSAGTLTPSFAPDTTSYATTLQNRVNSISVTPKLADETATVTLNGARVASGGASSPIALSVGTNTITVLVSASDGTSSKAYTIVVSRAAPMDTVLWRHMYDFNYLWVMNVDKASAVVGLPPVAGANWIVAGTGDLDGNGFKDIFWFEKTTGSLYIGYMNGTDVIGVQGLGNVVQGTGNDTWLPEAVGDFDGDGIPDVLWRQQNLGSIAIWYFNRDGSYVASDILSALDPAKVRMAGVAPNPEGVGEGTDGMVWSYDQFVDDGTIGGVPAGTAMLWRAIKHARVPGYINMYVLGTNASKLVYRVGDFDGDDVADLLWLDPATGATDLWHISATNFISLKQAMPAMTVGFQPAASVDFNSDGKTDVLWFNPTTGQAAQWLMNGRGNAPTQNSLGNVGTTWFLPNQ